MSDTQTIDLDALKVEVDKLVPNFSQYVESEDKITFDTRDRCLKLFAPLSVEEIEKAIHSGNYLLSWLANCDKLFNDGDYVTVITAFYTYPETVEKIAAELGKDAAHYKAKTGKKLTLSRYLSRDGSELSPLERTIARVTLEHSIHVFPARSPQIKKDALNNKVFSMSPTEYGKSQFLSTGKDGEVGIGIYLTAYFSKEYLAKEKKRAFSVLDEFDKEVFDACDRIHSAGNRYTTIPIIYREMGGRNLGKTMKKSIIESLVKMSAFTLDFNNDMEIAAGYNYKKISAFGTLVPNKILVGEDGVRDSSGRIIKVNGKVAETLVDFFNLDPFPLSNDYLQRGQVQELPDAVNQLPARRGLDRRKIMIRRFLLDKITWKKFNSRIAWSGVYKAANAGDNNEIQKRCRKYTEDWLAYWQTLIDEDGRPLLIKSYTIKDNASTFTVEVSPYLFKNQE